MRTSTAIALLALAGVALGPTNLAAQSSEAQTPPGAAQSDAGPPRGPDGAGPRRGRDGEGPRRGPGGPDGPGPRRGPPPHEEKGFDIRLDDDRRLKVDCGREPLEACIEAAAPLLELLSTEERGRRGGRGADRDERREERGERREERGERSEERGEERSDRERARAEREARREERRAAREAQRAERRGEAENDDDASEELMDPATSD